MDETFWSWGLCMEKELPHRGALGVWPEDALVRIERLEAALLHIAQEECQEANGLWCSADPATDCEHNVARRALGLIHDP